MSSTPACHPGRPPPQSILRVTHMAPRSVHSGCGLTTSALLARWRAELGSCVLAHLPLTTLLSCQPHQSGPGQGQ